MSDAVECRGVGVDYGPVRALAGVDLTVGRGEAIALLGASGSGKSTLINAIAGLVPISSGEIRLDGQVVADPHHSVAADRRRVGVVFQNFALWPHLSVLETVAYPLRRAGRSARSAAIEATGLLERLAIVHLCDRRPAELSGGEQQRVGLARALARNADLYLLDEPTAHLDTHLRRAFLDSVRERQRDTGAAFVYATHDAGEALALADRVGLIVDGQLVALTTPELSYCQPPSEAAARLTGPCFLLNTTVFGGGDGHLVLDFGAGAVTVVGGPPQDGGPGRRSVMVRPDWVGDGGPFRGIVAVVAFRGPITDYHLATPVGPILLSRPGGPVHAVGDTVHWSLKRVWIMPGSADPAPEFDGVLDQSSAAIAPA
jgi:ABC-type Fe3+/spermidine/putrescine transport system ATPase subunit